MMRARYAGLNIVSQIALSIASVLSCVGNAAELDGPLFKGCKERRDIFGFYPVQFRELNLIGRVLLLAERTDEGALRVIEVVWSEPVDTLAGTAKALLEKHFRCSRPDGPIRGNVSITFSLLPGPEVAHFEGVTSRFAVRGTR